MSLLERFVDKFRFRTNGSGKHGPFGPSAHAGSALDANPLLYQVDTRIVLDDIGRSLGRAATFDDVPDSLIDSIAHAGFRFVWLLDIWQSGAKALHHAISVYTAHADFGGDAALARLRKRFAERQVRLVLDFVSNHVALDHPWVVTHPEFFIAGTEDDLTRHPDRYARVVTKRGEAIFALGRDPHFSGWPGTLQLNYRDPDCRAAVLGELRRVADRCDGVRCGMAMLVEPDVFARTWGDAALPRDGSRGEDQPFWSAAIAEVHREHPRFQFIAEVYWGLEWQLQQRGFDFTYDQRLYDRLRSGDGRLVREHLEAAPAFQSRCLRYLENHDTPRAAAVFSPQRHRAAAVIAFVAPGMRFFHEGQLVGRKERAERHVERRVDEPADEELRGFYARLFSALERNEAHTGTFRVWRSRNAWPGSHTYEQFVVTTWSDERGPRLLAAVNYGPARGQCFTVIDLPEVGGGSYRLIDLLGTDEYVRDGDEMRRDGLYLDMPGWGFHLFRLERL